MQDKKFKIYFYFCAMSFFVLLFIILYYSFGYKYNIEAGKTIQTGMIILKTTPKDVTVYNNGQVVENNRTITSFFNNQIKIEELEKGKYSVKIEKENYHSWEKNVLVEGGLVTNFTNIVLLRENYTKNLIFTGAKSNLDEKYFWTDNQGNMVLYQKGNNLQIFEIKNMKDVEIIDIDELLQLRNQNASEIENAVWSDNDTKLIIKIRNGENHFWYFLDLENENEVTSLNNIFEENVEIKNKWNLHFAENLFFIKNNDLYRIDYKTFSEERLLANISSFSVYNNLLYYFVKDDNSLYSTTLNDFSKMKTIATMPDNFNTLLAARITATNEKTFTVLSSTGNLYFIDGNNEVFYINSFVEEANFLNDNQRIVYNNKHEMWIYYINQNSTQSREKELENQLITRFSGIISNVSLYKDGEHLIYQEGDRIKFLEIDDRDRRNVFELMKFENNNIFYSKNINSLFYIENNNLLQMNLDEE